MTTGDRRGVGDPLRRVILGMLAIYLAPVALIVLIIGGVGLACCAVQRLFEGGGPSRSEGRIRRDRMVQIVAIPHLGNASRSRSPG